MTQRFDELVAQRDPLYAAMKPTGEFAGALESLSDASQWWWTALESGRFRRIADAAFLRLTIRALRNQGQPYYRTEAQP